MRQVEWDAVQGGRVPADKAKALLEDWRDTGNGRGYGKGARDKDEPASVPVLIAPFVLIARHARVRLAQLQAEAQRWQAAEDRWAQVVDGLCAATATVTSVQGISRQQLIDDPLLAEALLDVTSGMAATVLNAL